MNESYVEPRLRAWYHDQIPESLIAPSALRADVLGVPKHSVIRTGLTGGPNRRVMLLAVALLVAISLIGIAGAGGGILQQPTTAVEPSAPATAADLSAIAPPGRQGSEVLLHSGNGLSDLLAIDPTNGNLRPLINDQIVDYAAWSPDGRRLAYGAACRLLSAQGPDDPTPCAPDAGFWLADESGSRHRIVSNDNTPSFSWSPDSSRIAFVLEGMWVSSVDSRGLEALAVRPVGDPKSCCMDVPVWSPDGRTLYVASDGIYRVAADSAAAAELLVPEGKEVQWAPDGSRLAVRLDHSVALVDTATGSLTELASSGPMQISAFAWSQDGRRIAYSQLIPPTAEVGRRNTPTPLTEVWVLNVDDGSSHRIARIESSMSWVTNLVWAPDGLTVAIGGLETFLSNWYAAAADGSDANKPFAGLRSMSYLDVLAWDRCLCTLVPRGVGP